MSEMINIHQRLALAMHDVTYIQKEKKQGMQYTIVSHDAVTAKVRPVLLNHGIVYYPTSVNHTQNGNRAECSMTVRFVNIDQPEDFFEVQTFGYGVDGQDKGPGKAMSYAVKYALLKALGLETGDDADHDNIPHDTKDPNQTPPPVKKVSPEEAEILADMATRGSADRVRLFEYYQIDGETWADVPEAQFVAVRKGLQAKLDTIDAEHDAATKGE